MVVVVGGGALFKYQWQEHSSNVRDILSLSWHFNFSTLLILFIIKAPLNYITSADV